MLMADSVIPVPVKNMARKRPAPGQSPGRPPIGRQVNIRIPAELMTDLEYIGDALGMDLSNLIRTVLVEQLHIYLERARLAKEASDRARAKTRHEGD